MFYRRTPAIPGNDSIAELKMVEINGVKQAILVRGESRRNPILLFLHGGPGSAQISFARMLMKDLEKDFIVVNWDQRGAGLSYSPDIPKESMTLAQFIEDTRVLCEMLLKQFGQEKLFLVGHSWGTVLGTLTAARYPHLFHAYVGMGQVTSMDDNEATNYRWTLEQAKQRGLTKAVRELEQIGQPPYGVKETKVQRKWLGKFKGLMRNGSIPALVLKTALTTTEYTLSDFRLFSKGSDFSLETLWGELMSANLPVQAPRLDVPVYYILGRYDRVCPCELAEAYFDQLQAPSKELFWFENSAHGLMMEEPEEFAKVLRKVLQDYRSRKSVRRMAKA